MQDSTRLALSGERLTATYHLRASAAEAEARARAICVEQTVEFPPELIAEAAIHDQVIGEVRALRPLAPGRFELVVAYPVEAAGGELTQLINLLFGNISIQPGVRLVDLELPPGLAAGYRGPRFGREGLRACCGDPARPLLCTALKPMGRSPAELAELAYRLACGGIDLIKDDHGLTDQSFCRFEPRVRLCAEAVARANRECGGHTRYLPNVTAPAGELRARAQLARAAGAGGLLVCPGLVGFDAMRALADDDTLGLPILAHPAFQGAHCANPDGGLAHGVLYGLFNRLAGADATIFPSWGGRFAYTAEECRALVAGASRPFAGLRPILPVPAGGMRLDRVGELLEFYGRDAILLIGGDLHRGDLSANCARFVAAATA
ncbi:RuBisCO large subunit C-terminal-like domain-containing protein [Marichromatium gracile]|uniref:Ribulose 1,5-bisphosphate carboxylase large subunit n=1 Tax=Marichromatium gracile TaxID=1048 RepID=A0ABR5VFR7_MARGR|nr:RuBisCO large subunit C-terminal-like domain-containing protein [Marichromatium gracile]KXX64417.1 ribulose 1,5-bisphosphate carboxylase large subunit [Marichromatium gracile]